MRTLESSRRGGFTFDISGDLDIANRLSDNAKKVLLAQRRAISTMKRRLKVQARRDIQTEYNLKAQVINERLSVSRTYDGITLLASSRGVNLINFGARQTRVGVTYSVKKGTRKTLAHAFIRATHAGDGPYVWMRGDAGGSYSHEYSPLKAHFSGRHGYPIFQQFGPSVAQMLKHGDRPERLVAFSEQIIESELDRQLGPK